HHKIPKHLGGDDKYKNLIFIIEPVHKLVHATNKDTISLYMEMLNLNIKQLEKLNKLRVLAGLEIIK
ncbi:MAG: group II intron reverse transcriptase/maturase, partial [Clostridia bacterium]|nr:group II intron reverse transcriptase/maturase [Clostridia bacterium]